MKGSDQCALMAELAAAETTVSCGENQKGSRQDGGATLTGVREERWVKSRGRSPMLSCHVLFFCRVFNDIIE